MRPLRERIPAYPEHQSVVPAAGHSGEPTSDSVLIVTTVPGTHAAFFVPHVHLLRSRGLRVFGMASGLTQEDVASEYDAVFDLAIERSVPPPTTVIRAIFDLRQVIERHSVDIVFCHTPVASGIARLACFAHRKTRVVYMAHGFHFGVRGPYLVRAGAFIAEWLLSACTDVLVTVNEVDYRAAVRLPGRTPDNTYLSPGVGIDVRRLRQCAGRRTEMRRACGVSDDAVVLLVVGELTRQKRVADAIAVARHVAASTPTREIVLLVAGSGRDLPALRSLAAQQSGADVRFLGRRQDVPFLMCGADVLVHPSEREGLPTVVLEAQALDLPVVGAEVRGTCDLLREVPFCLAPVGNVQALAAAVRTLLQDDAARARAREAGRRSADRHDVNRAAPMLADIVISASPRR
jgi:glycosyltransferase EpsD